MTILGIPSMDDLKLKEAIDQHTVREDSQTPMETPTSSLQRFEPQSYVEHHGYQDTQLCRRCKELDFENKLDGLGFQLEIDMGMLNSACTLCKFLQTSLENNNWLTFHEESNTWLTFHEGKGYKAQTEMRFLPKTPTSKLGELVCYRSPSGPTKDEHLWSLEPAILNFETLRAKFEHCRNEHTSFCSTDRIPVDNLRVFNCITQELENATVGTKYAALSYVWGRHPETSVKYPRTISDAFEVVQAIGLRYIWVDQLCIDQDSAHKTEQIRQMHNIYNNAEVTIVAAAGDSSNYGIPGVQATTPRKGRTNFRIGCVRFVQKDAHPELILKRTTWASRGWTFQEEQFSNRLLVFTDREAWFSCRITKPSQTDWKIPQENTGDDHNDSHFRNLMFPSNIEKPIERYTRRNLTYQTDVINAISGVLGRLEQARPPVYHLWGSPVPFYSTLTNPRSSLEGFLVGMQWECPQNSPMKRRAGFPSWSWTGWIGPVNMSEYTRTRLDRHPNTEVSVALELEGLERLDWSDFEKRLYLKGQVEPMSPFIYLTAWTMSVRLERFQGSLGPESELRAVVQIMDGGEILCQAILLVEGDIYFHENRMAELEKHEFTGILLTTLQAERPYVMLVSEMGEYYERVGYFWICDLTMRYGSGQTSLLNQTDLEFLQIERKQIKLG